MTMDDETTTALMHLETKLENIRQKYVPVSEDRLNKLWTAVRETIDEFSNQLVGFQEDRVIQTNTVETLSAKVDNLNQQVVLLSVSAPQDTTGAVNDLGIRLLKLEQQNVSASH